MLPSTGWLPTNQNFDIPPENWPIPQEYVGLYYDPAPLDISNDGGCDPGAPSGVVSTSVLLGSARTEADTGWTLGGQGTLQIKVIQTGVFGVVLFDSVRACPLPERCYPVSCVCATADLLPCTGAADAVAPGIAVIGSPAIPAVDEPGAIVQDCVCVKPDFQIQDDNSCAPEGTLITYVDPDCITGGPT